jgi:hypothetical protein
MTVSAAPPEARPLRRVHQFLAPDGPSRMALTVTPPVSVVLFCTWIFTTTLAEVVSEGRTCFHLEGTPVKSPSTPNGSTLTEPESLVAAESRVPLNFTVSGVPSYSES